jgi:hypothetical protein
MPIIKEAQVKLKETDFQQIGNQLGIPGIDMPVQKTGQFNHGQESYKKKLDSDFKNFMADIDQDNAELVELQPVVQGNSGFRDSDSLLRN